MIMELLFLITAIMRCTQISVFYDNCGKITDFFIFLFFWIKIRVYISGLSLRQETHVVVSLAQIDHCLNLYKPLVYIHTFDGWLTSSVKYQTDKHHWFFLKQVVEKHTETHNMIRFKPTRSKYMSYYNVLLGLMVFFLILLFQLLWDILF